jgi:fucose 4-O-acetylase-like acetyltransferase
MRNRSYWVDYAKAIGIILVVYGHVARGIYSAGLPIDASTFRMVDSIIYSFHMPLFFFLSGLFFYESLTKRGAGGLIVNKIDTIAYPFIIWSLLQGSIELALSNYTTHSTSYLDVLSFAWNPRAQFWFLYALFWVFVLSALIYSLVSKAYSALLLLFFAVLFVVSKELHAGVIVYYIAGNTVFFVFGIVFNDIKDFFERRCKALAMGLGIAFLAGQYIFHFVLGLTYDVVGVTALMLAAVSILFVVSLSMCLDKVRLEWFMFIGTSSMAIYLMHVLAGSGARIILAKVAGVQAASVHLAVGTLVGITVPLLALTLIERYKLNFLFVPPPSISATCLVERLSKKASST